MIVARRYARALYEEGERQAKTTAVDEDVSGIRSILDASADLLTVFRSPVIPRGKKENIIRELFREQVSDLTLNFLLLLVKNDREEILSEILSAYSRMRDEHVGAVEARARVAKPMTDEDQEVLVRALENLTGRQVRLHVEEEPGLIGGVVIRIDDVVYDASVQRQLDLLREKMEDGSYLLN